MGSGSSKDKNSKTVPSKADNVSKSSKALTIENKGSPNKEPPFKIKKDFSNTETQNSNNKTNNNIQNGSNENYNSNNKVSETNKRTPAKTVDTNLGRFDSDSESEGEDIADVLAATRRAQNNRVQEQNDYNKSSQNETAYPETYAQRLQREQYKHQQLGMIRQKTIYRNPDEWDVDENEMTSFDVSKFKQANVGIPTSQTYGQQNNDIYSTDEVVPSTKISRNTGPDPDAFYPAPTQTRQYLPRYDTSEEALLDEIEKEYEL